MKSADKIVRLETDSCFLNKVFKITEALEDLSRHACEGRHLLKLIQLGYNLAGMIPQLFDCLGYFDSFTNIDHQLALIKKASYRNNRL